MKEFEAKVRLNEEDGGKTGELDIMSQPPFDKGYFNGVTYGITFKEPFFEAEKKSGWIPCSERLPEDERPVLIYAWNVHHVVARYGQFRTQDGGYKNAWVTADAWFGNTEIKHKVIAWMPLPEPYKEGEKE